jgi:hypothetical protein
MTEDFGPTEQLVRQQWAVYHDTVRRLGHIGGLHLIGLEQVRRDLRPGGIWTADTIPAGFEEQRIVLLHDVATLLGEVRGISDYYAGVGDTLPAVPDVVPEAWL